jgi:hypothetical protein
VEVGVGVGLGVGLDVGRGRGDAGRVEPPGDGVAVGEPVGLGVADARGGPGTSGPVLGARLTGGASWAGGEAVGVEGTGCARTASGRCDHAYAPLTTKAKIAARMSAAYLPGCARSSAAAHSGNRNRRARRSRGGSAGLAMPSERSSPPVVRRYGPYGASPSA